MLALYISILGNAVPRINNNKIRIIKKEWSLFKKEFNVFEYYLKTRKK